jgi:hypothetical protein
MALSPFCQWPPICTICAKFLLGLDFFHTYKLALKFIGLTTSLSSSALGWVLCHWVTILHHQASTYIMLHSLPPGMVVEFS